MPTKKSSSKSSKPGPARRAQGKQNPQSVDKVQIAAVVILIAAVLLIVGGIVVSQASQASPTPKASGAKTFSAAPPMTIDQKKQYTATVKMATGGEFVIQLFADKAPITVNSFVFLARQGYFDGLTFHRVLKDFMAQGGDPTGTGGGGPGYEFVNEDSDLKFDKEGMVAMANAGRDTNGSQFFITFGPQEYLNGGYTIFGQVISGMDVVKAIRLRNPEENPTYSGDAMQSVTITEK